MNAPRYECDVAVIGAGPAGIAAAATAAESGSRVIVVDEGVGPGGQIWRPSATLAPPRSASRWLARLTSSRATVLRSTSVIDLHAVDGAFIIRAESNGAATEIAAASVVLATGARELFLPFPGWTLPNVFGIGGAQALLKSGMNFSGRRVVISGSGPLMFPVAASLSKAGAKVILVAEQASRRQVMRYTTSLLSKPSTLAQAAVYRWAFARSPYRMGQWVASARGDDVLREVTITDGAKNKVIACDVLCTGFGLVPNAELARLVGCDVTGRSVIVDARQATSVRGIYAAGEPTGIGGVDMALVEGEIAGTSAAGQPLNEPLAARRRALARDAGSLATAFALRAELRTLAAPDTVVCRCEDVRFRDLDPNWHPRQAKLYTRAGMGPCQGRVCGAALECVMGWPSDSVRPPIQPGLLSTLVSDSPSSSSSFEQGVH